jgi:hypothetical protein
MMPAPGTRTGTRRRGPETKGRIRLSREQGGLLRLILEQHLAMQWSARESAPAAGLPRSTMNRSIRLTRLMLAELQRTEEELEW